jgi:hypothetical protein
LRVLNIVVGTPLFPELNCTYGIFLYSTNMYVQYLIRAVYSGFVCCMFH